MSGWFAKLGAVLDSVDNTATAQVGKLKHPNTNTNTSNINITGNTTTGMSTSNDSDENNDDRPIITPTVTAPYSPSSSSSSLSMVSARSNSNGHGNVVRPLASTLSSSQSHRVPTSSPSDDDLMKLLNAPTSPSSSSSSSSILTMSSSSSSHITPLSSSSSNINASLSSPRSTTTSITARAPALPLPLPSSSSLAPSLPASSLTSVSAAALDAAFDDILGPSTSSSTNTTSITNAPSSLPISSSLSTLDDVLAPSSSSSSSSSSLSLSLSLSSVGNPISSLPSPSILPPPAVSSSAPTPTPDTIMASSSSSSSSDVSSEVAGLRAVWQQSREALSRTKALLLTKEEQYKKSLRDRDTNHQRAIDDIHENHEKEIAKMKKTIVQNQQEFEEALAAKANFTRSQDRVMEEAKEKLAAHHEEIHELTRRISLLETERDDMARMHQASLDAHSRALKSLRDAQIRSEQELAEEKNKNRSTLGSIISRESSLEADNAENVNALAAAHRMMEDKSKELQRVLSEKRWIEADQQALHDQLSSLRQRVDIDQKQSSSIITTLRTQLKHATTRIDELQDKLNAADTKIAEDSDRHRELERQLAAGDSNPLQGRIKELEYKLSAMGDNVFSKNAQLERVSSERSALRLQLETETNRIQTLEKRMKELYEQRQNDEFGDIENGGNTLNGGLKLRGRPIHTGGLLDLSSSDDLKSRTVDRAVTFLDGMGAYVGTLLRRYPQVRLGFAAYILLLHLWVAFVLWHFTHHTSSLPP